jgi:ribonuclease D
VRSTVSVASEPSRPVLWLRSSLMQRPTLISSDAELAPLIAELSDASVLCIDCEFHSEKSYYPLLCLVQLAWDEQVVALDARKLDLSPLAPVLSAPGVRKVLHDGRQDVALLARATGASAIENYTDTRVAAGFVGFGSSVGLAQLARELCAVTLEKSLQNSDWTQRLTDAQLAYALDDVRYLARIDAALRERLIALGRLSWCESACESVARRALKPADPEAAYRKLGGLGRMSDEQLGVLRAVAAWRERAAAALDKPVGFIASELALKQLCYERPRTRDALKDLRGLGAGRTPPWDARLIEAIVEGEATPVRDRPADRSEPEGALDGLVNALSLVRRVVASREGVASELLADRAALEALAEWHIAGRPAPIASELFEGWRRALIGDVLRAVLDAELVIAADATQPTGLALRPAR